MSGVVVNNSFENGTVGQSYDIDQQKSEWNYLNGGSRTEEIASISDDVAIDGSQSLRVDYSSEDRVQTASKFSLPDADEYYSSYSVYFPEEFEFNGVGKSGGKLPGLGADEVPTGGDDVTGDNGFSARYMWRLDGQAELYLYHMDKAGQFGDSVSFFYEDGSYAFFERGEWNTITQRIKMNDAGVANGEIDVWLNGDLVVDLDRVRLSDTDQPIDVFYLSTFYGGGSKEWLPQNDTTAYFDNFIISTDAQDVGLSAADILTPEENTYHGDGPLVRELRPYTRTIETDAGIVEITHDKQWGTGYTASVSLTPEQMVEGWVVQIKTPGPLEKLWDGEIVSYVDGVYTLRSTANPDLNAGETGTIRIKGEGNASLISVVGGAENETVSPVEEEESPANPTPPAEEDVSEQPATDPAPEETPADQPAADDPATEEGSEGEGTAQEPDTAQPDAPAPGAAAYDVNIRSEWNDGFVADLSFTPVSAVEGWTAQITFAGNIENIWNADILAQDGDVYTITGKPHNANLNAGEAASLTIKGSGDLSTLAFGPSGADPVVSEPATPQDETPPADEAADETPTTEPEPEAEAPSEPVTDPAPTPDSSSSYGVTIEKEWSDGFIAVLEYTADNAVDGWTAQITFAGEIESIWKADIIRQDGDTYTIAGKSYNADVDAGETLSIKLKASGDSSAIAFGPAGSEPSAASTSAPAQDEFVWADNATGGEETMPLSAEDGLTTSQPGSSQDAMVRNDDTGASMQGADMMEMVSPTMAPEASFDL